MSDKEKEIREKIMDHINLIFQSFIKQDREAIRKAHTEDWVGFLGSSKSIERGIDAYMKITELSLKNFKGTGYEILDTEIQLYGDIAVVYYIARYDYIGEDNQEHSLPLRSIDIYRRESGGWNQAGSHITPIPSVDSKSEDEW